MNIKTNLQKLAVSKPIVALAALLTVGGGAGAAALASAQTPTTTTTSTTASTQTATGTGMRSHMMPGVFGKITAINGTTLTIESQGWGKSATATTYTVDASAATVEKGGSTPGATPTTVDISTLAVGDSVAVEGTVSGTSVAATKIMSGMMGFKGGMGGPGHRPGVEGTVSAVNGNTLTITGENGTTYTVDATSAKASKISTITTADIQVGDRVGVEGTLSGTTVTAQTIMDGVPQKSAATSQTTTTQN